MTLLLGRSYLSYLYPSCSAGLNKSHQAGSDSSCVDSVPNVVWRLCDHEIGPSRGSFRDVFPSLDGRLARSRACLNAHETEMLCDMTCAADIFSHLRRAGAIGSGPLLPTSHPRKLLRLFIFPLPSALPCNLLLQMFAPKDPPALPKVQQTISPSCP